MAASPLYATASSSIVLLVSFRHRRQTRRSFSRGAFRIEGEKTGEDLVLEFRRPVEPRFGRLALIGILFDEFRRGAVGEIVPAIGAQHGSIHFGVKRAQAGDIGRLLARARGSGCRSWSALRSGQSSASRGRRDRPRLRLRGSSQSQNSRGTGRCENSRTV